MPAQPMRRVAGVIAAAALLAGCLDQPVQSTTPTIAPTPEPTPVTTTYQLDTTVWYEGLLVHVDTVAATLDERGGPVQVRLRLENPTDTDSDLDGRILLKADATSADPPIAPTRESKVPTAPAKGVASTVLSYELQGIDSLDKAVLLVGEAPLHVARVPLTEGGGAAEVFEPVTLKVAGSNIAGDLRITLRRGSTASSRAWRRSDGDRGTASGHRHTRRIPAVGSGPKEWPAARSFSRARQRGLCVLPVRRRRACHDA